MADLAFITYGCTAWVIIPLLVAAIVWACLGIVFFLLWAFLCIAPNGKSGCRLLKTVINVISIFDGAQFLAVLVLAGLGLGGTCGLGALIGFAYYATVGLGLWWLGQFFKCW
jgi:hypothetical protein